MFSKRMIGLISIVIFAILFASYFIVEANKLSKGEEIIQAYMAEKEINVRKGSEAYTQFMKDILLGEYPDLTGEHSEFVSTQQELDWVLEHAGQQLGKRLVDLLEEPEIPEASSQIGGVKND